MKIAWFSCDETAYLTPGYDTIAALAPDVIVAQGDVPYTAGSDKTIFGYSTVAATAASTEAELRDIYRQYWDKPSAKRLLALRASIGMEAYWLGDDHEWTGDNWDHTVTQANSPISYGFTTQATVNTHWNRANKAQETVRGTRFDNPAYDQAGNTERPAGALQEGQNPSTENYPIKYFHKDYGNLLRVIFIDCLSYRSPLTDAQSASKRMLRQQQQDWLLARVAEATQNHVVVMSTKKLYGTTGGNENGDTCERYSTERDTWLAAIQATGKPVIWCSGDRHNPHVMSASVAGGAAADIVDVCACPIGVSINGVGRAAASAGARVDWIGFRHCFGLLTADASGLVAEVRSADTGSVMYSARFAPGSKTPFYAPAPEIRRSA